LSEPVDLSVARLRARAGARRPQTAVILGSGWQTFAGRLAEPLAIGYGELPAFPGIGVDGHAGNLLLGRIGGCEVAVLSGRGHAYESGRADAMKGAIASLAALGVTTLVQTNAAGSLDAAMPPGSLMLVADHLNVAQLSPLLGERDSRRFVDLKDPPPPPPPRRRRCTRACTRSCSGRSSRRRPRSACCSGSARRRWA
jgi:purine-nucleoside phosphorylase